MLGIVKEILGVLRQTVCPTYQIACHGINIPDAGAIQHNRFWKVLFCRYGCVIGVVEIFRSEKME